MFELMFCSLFTLVPDFLYRRYVQGKRIGHEITIYSVWYELRYGITTCLMLTVSLITAIFYFHPSTTNVVGLYRAVPIVPEIGGRVAEVYVGVSADVAQGQPLFRLDSSKQEAALEVAKRNIAEIDARMVTAKAEIAAAEGQVQQAKGDYEQATAFGRRVTKSRPEFVNGYKPLIAALGHLGRREEAKFYVAKLLSLEPSFTVERFGQVYPFKYTSDREHYMTGLRLAGVPEN